MYNCGFFEERFPQKSYPDLWMCQEVANKQGEMEKTFHFCSTFNSMKKHMKMCVRTEDVESAARLEPTPIQKTISLSPVEGTDGRAVPPPGTTNWEVKGPDGWSISVLSKNKFSVLFFLSSISIRLTIWARLDLSNLGTLLE